MDPIQLLYDLRRRLNNQLKAGVVIATKDNTVKISIKLLNNKSTVTQYLPLIGRKTAVVGEPVMVMFPAANFNEGIVFCLKPDPQIAALEERLKTAETAITRLEEVVRRLDNY